MGNFIPLYFKVSFLSRPPLFPRFPFESRTVLSFLVLASPLFMWNLPHVHGINLFFFFVRKRRHAVASGKKYVWTTTFLGIIINRAILFHLLSPCAAREPDGCVLYDRYTDVLIHVNFRHGFFFWAFHCRFCNDCPPV